MPLATFGLTHLAIAVPDLERAFEFYALVFGMVAVYRDGSVLQAQTPGARDALVFERSDLGVSGTRATGGIAHFGFRLANAGAMGDAAALVRAAGGTIEDQGEFVAGEPYLFVRDRDGYLVEIWFEIPTAMDPQVSPAV